MEDAKLLRLTSYPLIAALCLLVSPALAGSADWCVEAIDDGRNDYVSTVGGIFIKERRELSESDIPKAERCVSATVGGPVRYDPQNHAFRDKSGAVIGGLTDEETAAETKARTEKFIADVEQRQAERRADVVERLTEACTRQYRRDADATIMNKLCFDVFMERGLPD